MKTLLRCAIALTITFAYAPTLGHAEDGCPVPANFLPSTPLPTNETPPPHPEPDCPFYRDAWQYFLHSAQPQQDGRPRFLSEFATVAQLFGPSVAPQFAPEQRGLLSLAPRTAQYPNEKVRHATGSPPGLDDGVNQAGPLRGLLIDRNGHPIYYAIHVNDVFKNFLTSNKLLTKEALLAADPELKFPEGALEIKSAWQVVTPDMPRSEYFITAAAIPQLTVRNGDIVNSGSSRRVDVALVAIHIVFTLKGHPEFVWSTFEHVGANGDGIRDNAPAATTNPPLDPSAVVSTTEWPLFKAGTTASGADIPNSSQDRLNAFDEQTQSFTRQGRPLTSSVYRMYPASKSNTTDEDSDIVAVNASMRDLFKAAQLMTTDRRKHYQLVGAIWLDQPGRDFRTNILFQNQPNETTDTPGAMVAGEDRLSSTAMESFTQGEDGRPNCLSCHNTKHVTDDRTGKQIVPAKSLNVSHVMSKFLSEQ